MVQKSGKARVLELIDRKRDEIVKLIQSLIQIPSEAVGQIVEGRFVSQSDLEDVLAFVNAEMKDAGLEIQHIGRKGCEMPIGTLRGSRGKPTLLFYGHVDTVPAGPRELWKMDPFGASISDGIIYGRGAADDKGQFACALILPKIFAESGVELGGDLKIMATVDEEIGGVTGIRYAMEKGLIKEDFADFGVYTEGYSLDCTNVAFMGSLAMEITVIGRGGPPALIETYVNPIDKAANVVTAFHEVFFPKLRERRSSVPPENSSLPPYGTVACTIIDGGFKENIVPEKCSLTIDRRLIPEENITDAEKEIVDFIAGLKRENPELKVELRRRVVVEPYLIPNWQTLGENQPICRALSDAVEEVLSLKLKHARSMGANPDMMPELNIPILGYGCGRLEIAKPHRPNEAIVIKDVINAVKIYSITAMKILGFK